MALIDTPRSKAITAIVLAALIGYMGYSGDGLQTVGMSGLKARQERVAAMRDSLALLVAQTDSVKKALATGTAEELQKQTEDYLAVLATLRQLVPEKNEVPGLIDAILGRAKMRGVYLAGIKPQPVEPGPAPFDTYRYQFSVIGRYDEIGEFLADVAGLRRIMVPYDVSLAPAQAAAARALGDTSRAMLESRFMLKTFVKSAGAEGEPRGN